MASTTMRWLYERLGRRYLRTTLIAQFQIAHLVVAGAVILLNTYRDLDTDEFWRILLFAEVLVLLENGVAYLTARRLVRPARRWLDGDQNEAAAVAAWHALAALPRDFLLDRRLLPLAASIVPLSAYVQFELQAPFYPSFFIIVAAAGIVLMYAAFLRFFGIELIVRPVLERISLDMPDGVRLGPATLSVRLRVLLSLPTINIISGVVIAGITAPDDGGLGTLGFGVLATLAVSFTLSLAMSAMLIRSILEPIEELREGTLRVIAGDLSVRVPVLGSDESGSLAGSFNQMVAGLRERKQLHEALGAYVAPVVADRVLEEGTVLEPKELEVTVLFLDMRGFTAFAEGASAAEVVDRLNGFFQLVVPVLTSHGGHLDKFVGDGLLGVFGAPDTMPDHPDRAVAAGLDIAFRVQERYAGSLQIGIGVNTGPVVAGSVGGGGRVEFTVIGDAVNTAARVEEVTRATGDLMLITTATLDALRIDHGGFAERGEVELKGKRSRVVVHAPLALADIGTGPAATLTDQLRTTP